MFEVGRTGEKVKQKQCVSAKYGDARRFCNSADREISWCGRIESARRSCRCLDRRPGRPRSDLRGRRDRNIGAERPAAAAYQELRDQRAPTAHFDPFFAASCAAFSAARAPARMLAMA